MAPPKNDEGKPNHGLKKKKNFRRGGKIDILRMEEGKLLHLIRGKKANALGEIKKEH